MPDLTLQNYDADEAQKLLDAIIVPIYQDVYAHEIATEPFYSVERFTERFAGYSRASSFALCVATDSDSGEPLGFMFGYAIGVGGRWWNGLLTDVPAGFTNEDGQRTWAVNEIMVIEKARRRGVATALHDKLLEGRKEARATLLVEPDDEPAKTAYQSWGWTFVGVLQPFPDAPKYLSMVRNLPL